MICFLSVCVLSLGCHEIASQCEVSGVEWRIQLYSFTIVIIVVVFGDRGMQICREEFVSLHTQPVLANLSQSLLYRYGFTAADIR